MACRARSEPTGLMLYMFVTQLNVCSVRTGFSNSFVFVRLLGKGRTRSDEVLSLHPFKHVLQKRDTLTRERLFVVDLSG